LLTPRHPTRHLSLTAALVALLLGPGCALFRGPQGTPAPPPGPPTTGTEPLPVQKAPEEVVVAAWAEPKRLPPRGGQTQIVVRAQRRGGKPFEAVEVRIRTSSGTLYSQGKVLLTNDAGRTRDRLTTRRAATITVNAGGAVYRFEVPLRSESEDEAESPRP